MEEKIDMCEEERERVERKGLGAEREKGRHAWRQ